MKFATVAEVKQQLSKYIQFIEDTGEEVIITKNGHPTIIMKPITDEVFAFIKNKGEPSQKKKRG